MKNSQIVTVDSKSNEVSVEELRNKSADTVVDRLNGVSLKNNKDTEEIVGIWFKSVMRVLE